jgi:hypothetical protein
MDWFLLLTLVPLILVPVVVLCGFAGCKATPDLTFDAEPRNPRNLTAITIGPHRVDLSWEEDPGSVASIYVVERSPSGGVFAPVGGDVTATSFIDQGSSVLDGTTYLYRVSLKWDSAEVTNIATTTTKPERPTNLFANPVASTPGSTDSAIRVGWTNTASNADGFILSFHTTGGPTTQIDLLDPSQNTFTHHGLTPSDTYHYTIFAFVNAHDANNNPVRVLSDGSQPTAALAPALIPSPLVWKTAFQGVLNANLPGEQNKCVVQRLKAPLAFGGSQVKITLRGSSAGPIAIDRMTISQAAGAGNLYDSAADLVEVFGPPGVTLVANVPQTFGPTNYTLDPAKDLIVAFDIGATGAGRKGPLVGSAFHSHIAIDEAGQQLRSPGYVKTADSLFLIEKIEVLTLGP